MTEATITKIVREVVREWLNNNHSRLACILEAAAQAAAPILEREVRERLSRLVCDDADNQAEERYLEALNDVSGKVFFLSNNMTRIGKEDFQAILNVITKAKGGSNGP